MAAPDPGEESEPRVWRHGPRLASCSSLTLAVADDVRISDLCQCPMNGCIFV